MVGNGESIKITHVGSTSLNVGNTQLALDNVLVVPEIKKNLLSVSQLTSDHPYIFEFSSTGFVIKNRDTGSVIAMGRRSGDLYALQPKGVALFSNRFRVVNKDVWPARLGHPQVQIVDYLQKNKMIFSESSDKKRQHMLQLSDGKGMSPPIF